MESPQPGGAQAVTHDDRTALYGALLGVADLLKGADGPDADAVATARTTHLRG